MQDPTFFLRDLVVLFALAIVVVIACVRVRMPPIVGFLIAGVLAGPSALGLIDDVHSVEILAEIGVVLLLFSIGLEFSLESLARLKSTLFAGGGLQVALTTAAGALVAAFVLDQEWRPALFIGVLVAMSSTAIGLKLLADKAEVDSPQGRIFVGVAIFQDLCVVPISVLVPLLSGESQEPAELLRKVGVAMLMVIGCIAGGRYVVPRILGQVVRTRSRETFLLVVIILCLGTAWLGSLAGLSLALGAFIAGLVISQSPYSHQALGEIIPFRDAFSSLFFMSMGMLLDLEVLASPGPLLGVVGCIVAGKALIAGGIAMLLGYPFRVALIAGVCLAQVGEFSFVLAKQGQKALLSDGAYQLFLASAVITMLLTPVLKSWAPALAGRLAPFLPRRWLTSRNVTLEAQGAASLHDHVLIIGYGLNGRNLAQALRHVSIPYAVIEMNPETVKQERRRGEPIFYGDASSPEVLGSAGVAAARVLVIAVSDPTVIRRATELARRLNPGLHIIVRTRYLQEMRPLLELGANEVVPEEFETALEIFARTLRKLLVPRDVVDRFVREARVNNYGMLREEGGSAAGRESLGSFLGGAEVEVLRIEEGSPVSGRTLEASGLRRLTGATILAIQDGADILTNPPVSTELRPGTAAIVFGTPEQVASAARLLRAPA